MEETVYAVAQIQSVRENFQKNLDTHLQLIREAAKENAGFILFPEMSLTGYERELAADQSFTAEDERLDGLRQAAIEHHMVISAGGPLRIGGNLYIASWIFLPEGKQEIYIKKFLHPGEEVFYESREDYDPILVRDGERISFAICYDLENDDHIRKVAEQYATMYTASIFYSSGGIDHGLDRLQHLAEQYRMPVLMSNYCGTCWDMTAGGRSSIWSDQGELIISADEHTPCLILGICAEGTWHGKVIQ